MSSAIVFDIETEALPWDQLELFYRPEGSPGPWSDSMVKYGNTADPVKRAAKYEEVRAKWQSAVDDYFAAEEQRKTQFRADAAKRPYMARILSVGYMTDAGRVLIDGADGEDEGTQVQRFWDLYTKDPNRLWIGFNCHHYDIPLLCYRSWANWIPIPESVFTGAGRYFNPRIVDLMKVWACGSGQLVSLDTLCRLYGLGAKPDGVNGGAFAGLWNDHKTREQAIGYLTNDLQMTARLAQRMGVYTAVEN